MANLLIKKLVAFGVVFALLVVAVGAYTRLADAGLGCPDWPGCYGFLTVPQAQADVDVAEARYPDAPVEVVKAWWEMGHRYIAGALMALVFAMFVIAWRGRSENTPTTLLSALLVIITCQAAFGAWTVTLKLWPQVVTAHLSVASPRSVCFGCYCCAKGRCPACIEVCPCPANTQLSR